MLERLTRFSIDRPKTVIATSLLMTVLFGLQFPTITIDTDPENMLEPDQSDLNPRPLRTYATPRYSLAGPFFA